MKLLMSPDGDNQKSLSFFFFPFLSLKNVQNVNASEEREERKIESNKELKLQVFSASLSFPLSFLRERENIKKN